MAFSIAKNFTSVAGRMFTQCRYATSASVASKCFLSTQQRECQMTRPFTRSIWYLCSNRSNQDSSTGDLKQVWAQASRLKEPGKLCNCGCAGMHTQADEELANFLQQEIQQEKDSQQFPDAPKLPEFKVSQEGAEVTLTKTKGGETVKVIFNLNHSVEEEPQDEKAEKDDSAPASRLRSYPEFTVEITKDTQSSLTISCRFDLNELGEGEGEGEEPETNELFMIDQVSIHDGQTRESTYTVGSEVMDGNLYNCIMNMLEERGITDEFVEKLSDLSSALEHKLYIDFLEKLHRIAKF